jgi:hypothetical protein
MLENFEIQVILGHFGLAFQSVTKLHDTSHGEGDTRLNYILDDRYVLKVNSVGAMWEQRLQEISRLIARYRSIGVYCPALIPTTAGPLSYTWGKDGRAYTCYVEEYAIYPLFAWGQKHDRREVVEHLGILAAKYTGVDLSETKSMWSIIDLAPLDVDIDEKQENTNALVDALREAGYPDLAQQVDDLNNMLRSRIMTVFADLPRCVFQGDLNTSNELHQDGHFVGLIDFNLSGTDVNINVFLNETNWFPEEAELDKLSVSEIVAGMDAEQADTMSVILRHYAMNDAEKYAFPYYKRIVDLFQYPNVCEMVKWLEEDARKDKCVALIQALVDKPI